MERIIVQKYGGSSLADLDKIKLVATRVGSEFTKYEGGYKFVVVASAMQGETDKLVDYARSLSKLDSEEKLREYDTIVSSGEQVSVGLLALELQNLGFKARSLLGWQIPILTNKNYSNAKIQYIDAEILRDYLREYDILVVAGFQGFNLECDTVTTLGRGGSDTTAVAIASVLKAERCEICKDVEGIYAADPRMVHTAKKLDSVSVENLIQMTSAGAKMLHVRAAIMANRYAVNLNVKSTFTDRPGTMVVKSDSYNDNKCLVRNIVNSDKYILISIRNLENNKGLLHKFFHIVMENQIVIDSFSQNINENKLSIQFITLKDELDRLNVILNNNFQDYSIFEGLTRISIVGIGLLFNYTILERFVRSLNIFCEEIVYTSTNELKISAMVRCNRIDECLQVLYAEFIEKTK